jgi:hypothetical protein
MVKSLRQLKERQNDLMNEKGNPNITKVVKIPASVQCDGYQT